MDNEPAGNRPSRGPPVDRQTDMRSSQKADAAAGRGLESSDQSLTAESQDMIGQHLRKVYSDMVSEPLPDRFKDLLNMLSSPEAKS